MGFSDKEREFNRKKERDGYTIFRMVRDFTMAGLILGMAVFMLVGDKIPFSQLVIVRIDPVMRYMFGGLCLIYGSFRLYRAIKHEY